MRPTTRTLCAAAIAALVSSAAQAQPSQNTGSANPPATLTAPAVTTETAVLQGTVQAIDRDRRMVSVQGSDGRVTVMRAGPDLRNFSNLKVGDQVRATFTESVAVSILKGGTDIRQRVEAQAGTQAPAGGKPGVRAMERTTVVANVWEVDRNAGRVTLRGPEGQMMNMRVQDRQALQNLGKDDQVVVTYLEAAAVSIEPGAPRAKN